MCILSKFIDFGRVGGKINIDFTNGGVENNEISSIYIMFVKHLSHGLVTYSVMLVYTYDSKCI